MDSINWLQVVIFAVPVIIAITLHEAAHGFVALHYGDDTALKAHRVTLNPLRHIDPFGTIILPAMLILLHAPFVFGYAKPVPVNFGQLRNAKTSMIWVAGAGPGMNVFLALLSALLLFIYAASGADAGWLAAMLYMSVLMNFALAIFNMLPIPPLDGSKCLAGVLPNALAMPYLRLGRFGFLILVGAIILMSVIAQEMGSSFNLFGTIVWQPAGWLTDHLLGLMGMRAE